MTDIDPLFVPQKTLPRFYASASKSYQDELDGFDDTDPEQVLNRQDSERDYAHRQNHDDDVATPCYEQDDDYTDDRFPAVNENQRRRVN
jgi:hypothetical protein